ncbi:MAG TPA: VWA domain-containing protein [Pyrinomonadaceae bacterium]|nr:VWA domain-containing protein [Pyrinomonadaceae bacterium]
MKRSRVIPTLLLLSCLVSAQTPKPKPTPASSTTEQPSQAETDRDVIKINANLVQVDAVVTRSGKQVTDLTADDFEILEDGKPQVITNFSYVSNVGAAPSAAPMPGSRKARPLVPSVPRAITPENTHRTIALVVDDLGLSVISIARARNALRKFVNEQLEPNDLVAIVRTGGEIGALQQFTTDHRMLLSAIDHIRYNPCSRMGTDVFDYSDRTCSMNMTDTLDALRYIIGGMASLPGRKAMVLLSDNTPIDTREPGAAPDSASRLSPMGAGQASADSVTAPGVSTGGTNSSGTGEVSDVRTTYEQDFKHVAELAIRGSVVIYTIDARGLAITFPTAADTPPGRSITGWHPITARTITRAFSATLSARSAAISSNREGGGLMAQETGGFTVGNSNSFGLNRVYEDQQGYYLIGFRPTEETFDRKFHHISVRVKQSGFSVRSRKGFYGFTNDEARAVIQKGATSIGDALRSPFGANQITVRMSSLFTDTTDAGPLLRISIYVNAHDISFSASANDFHDGSFDIESILFGDNGKLIYQRSQTATLHLNPSQYENTLREGIVYGFDVPVKNTGAGQFRVAVHDHASKNLGTAGQVVMMPDLRKNLLTLSGMVLTPETAVPGSADSMVNVALRQFRQGEKLLFGYAIYNAPVGDRQPQLTAQTRVFHEGQIIFTGEPIPISIDGQSDLKRITAGSRLQLGPDFPPGDYILQVIVTNKLAKLKRNEVSQWIDFEVVK